MAHLSNRKKAGRLFYIALCIFVIMSVSACDNGTDPSELSTDLQTGTIVFRVVYDEDGQTARNKSDFLYITGRILAPESVMADFRHDCDDNHTIEAIIYDEDDEKIASGGPWNCSTHNGVITDVLAGINRKIALLVKDGGGNTIYRSEKEGITVRSGEKTEVTLEEPESFTPVLIADDGNLIASGNSTQIPMRWNEVAGAQKYRVVIKDANGKETEFKKLETYFEPVGLDPNSSYTCRVFAVDAYGNEGGNGEWTFSIGEDRDKDGDGYTEKEEDCNDNDASVYPGARDIPDDGVDQNCDGKDMQTWYKDFDRDDYSDGRTEQSPNQPNGYREQSELKAVSGDCNDNNASVHPYADDIPDDSIDQDCDGNDMRTWYKDSDNDAYSDGTPEQSPNRPDGYKNASELKSKSGDCNDNNAAVYPGAIDIPDDGMDQDCDAKDMKTWYKDSDSDRYSDGKSEQSPNQPEGYRNASELKSQSGDCNDNNASVNPGAYDIPDDRTDQDCDGRDTRTWYKDSDGDGYYSGKIEQAPNRPDDTYRERFELRDIIADCNDNSASVYPGAYDIPGDDIDQDCSGTDPDNEDNDRDGYTKSAGDCNDNDAFIHPGAADISDDGIDQDCDGKDTRTWYKDFDEDRYSDGATKQSPNQPEGYRQGSELKSLSVDCNDNNASVNPGAYDIPGDGIDQDCSGIDPYDQDDDRDGYTRNSGDCNDNNASVHPGAADIPDDGIDQNCDGKDIRTWYKDFDADGFSDGTRELSSDQPGGYRNSSELNSISGDCDDNDIYTHPGASDIPDDGIDQNCDGKDIRTWYKDYDADGYSDGTRQLYPNQPDGYFGRSELKSTWEDCNDSDPAVYPGAEERCYDSKDNDCDGETDFADPDCRQCADNDGDSHYAGSETCPEGDDCNDRDENINPGAKEVCNDSKDNDCDGKIDSADPDCSVWYKDFDRDGYSDGAREISSNRPADYFGTSELKSTSGDCNDNDDSIYPEAPEIAGDGIDQDCDDNDLPVPNNPPVADAGEEQTVYVGDTVTLDGTGSKDDDGDPLTYKWSFRSESGDSVLSNPDSSRPSFTPYDARSYVVQLVVNDGKTDSQPDSVIINVIPRSQFQGNYSGSYNYSDESQAGTLSNLTIDSMGKVTTGRAFYFRKEANFSLSGSVDATGEVSFSGTNPGVEGDGVTIPERTIMFEGRIDLSLGKIEGSWTLTEDSISVGNGVFSADK